MNRLYKGLGAAAAILALLSAAVLWRNLQGEAALEPDSPADLAAASTETLASGAYLARAGNCAACHTTQGGAHYAGGRGIATPFGTVYAGNLTPDPSTGLGHWSAAEFRRALKHGRSRDGRLLVPAFPYPHFSQVTRADADTLWAYLRSLPAVVQANRSPALRWPYSSPLALAVWRALYFSPTPWVPDAGQSRAWNRGAYLVNGLGHCGACHASRNLLGGPGQLADPGAGSRLAAQSWYAPSLADPAQASVSVWSLAEVVRLLQTGINDHAAVMGPMAEVVAGSTQYLSATDLQAMATYLRSLPPGTTPAPPWVGNRPADSQARGQQLYTRLCADCHGAQGQGAPGIYPPLAGNRIVTMAQTGNLLLAIRGGGFAPATDANPRPYGMPAFDLPNADLAALTTWLRSAWGHQAAPVSEVEVLLAR